jgi:adenine-specific DNA glycosylase
MYAKHILNNTNNTKKKRKYTMKVNVQFNDQEREVITAFADLVTDTCAAVHTECGICPF